MKKVTSVCRAHLLSKVDESLYIKEFLRGLFLISFLYLANNLINSSAEIISEEFLNVNLFIGIFFLFVYSFFQEALYASYDEFLDTIFMQVIVGLFSTILYLQ